MKFLKFILLSFAFIMVAYGQQKINVLETKDLTINGKYKAISTTLASKPCPAMTEVQRDAIASPTAGDCVWNTDSLTINAYNGSTWGSIGGGLSAWVTAFNYSIGNVVIESNKIYKALTDHTSGTFATDLGAGDWVELSAGIVSTGSITDNHIVRYDGTTGTLIQSSTGVIDDSGNLSGIADLTATGTTTLNTSLSGLIKAVSGVLSASSLVNADVSASAAIDYSKLAALGTGEFIFGNAGVPTVGTMSGGATVGATGVITLGNSAVITQLLTGYTPGAGTITSSDSILSAIQKLDANNGTNANLTGAITSIGNATSLGSFTSLELKTALTDETGSGASVFANTPSLISPDVGAATGTSIALGGTIDANAIADFQSTTKAFKPPRMTYAQMLAIPSPTQGMTVYVTDYASPVYYNGASWIFGYGSVQLDNLLSAEVSAGGAISKENRDFMGTCTNAHPSVCTFNSGYFTTAPNVNIGANTLASYCSATNVTTSGFSIYCYDDTGGATTTAAIKTIYAEKTGADYASTSGIFATTPTSQLALATDFSWQVSDNGIVSGESLDVINGNCTNANPTVCPFNSSTFTVAPNCTTTVTNTANNLALTAPATSTSTAVTIQQNSSLIATKEPFVVHCQRSGVDYENAARPFIVGSFEGVAKYLGYSEIVGSTPADGNIPADNTIPQIGEGAQIFSLTVTPTKIGAKIHVHTNIKIAEETNAAAFLTSAIFKDGAANAVASDTCALPDASPNLEHCRLVTEYTMTVASITPITFTVRVGGNGAGSDIVLNETTNSVGTDNDAGGTVRSWIKVTEEPF